MPTHVSASFLVEIDGAPLPGDVEIDSIEVEDHLHLPDTFTVTLRDAARSVISACKAKVGSKVKIDVLRDSDDAAATLIRGDITAIEADIRRGVSLTTLRGYDESHRLLQGRVTASYMDVTYADVAGRVAKRHGLKEGEITSTSPSHDQVTQAHESDWDFLWRLAREIGYEVAVSDGKLHFRPPKSCGNAGAPPDLGSDDALALIVGDNVMSLRVGITSAEQAAEVNVRGWDHLNKAVLTATEPLATVAVKHSLDPKDLASIFPGPSLVASTIPYLTDHDVSLAAKALSEEVASASTELDGRARGNVGLRAGAVVPLSLAGEPFDGNYVMTSTRHSYDADEGYVTSFSVSGRQDRSLLGIIGGGGQGQSSRIYGLTVGLVDDVNDPEDLSRVKLRFPWYSDDYVSDWARVVHYGAGDRRGWFISPEVDDEVLVGFLHGDMRLPYVLGGLYNGVDKPGEGAKDSFDGNSGAVVRRSFTSRLGHTLVIDDDAGGGGITLKGANGSVTILMDDAGQRIQITSQGDVEIKAANNITLDAGLDLTLKGTNVKVEASAQLELKGAQATLEASGPVKVAGALIQLN